MIQEKKDEDGQTYLSVDSEDDWHEALRRGRPIETPVQLAEQIGVPMNEDVGTLADIIAAADPWGWARFLSLWGKSGAYYARRVADDLIEQIRCGDAPWQKPWEPGERVAPENFSTGGRYTAGNSVYLLSRGIKQGFGDNRWGTYRQIEAGGGQVRKGEKGTQVLFWTQQKTRSITRQYTVFNVQQADGLSLPPRGGQPPPEWATHGDAEKVIEASGATVQHVPGDRAYYRVAEDKVVLPEHDQFPTRNSYYQTALHECGHSTGHPDRMDRDTLKDGVEQGFGSPEYAREELRAEISAMMTGERVGVGHDPQRASAYVENWVKVVSDGLIAGFMARLLALCSLPRTNPGNRHQYKRVNGPYKLILIAGGDNRLPYGNLPRLILAWVCTEAVRTQSRELVLGRSFSGFMRKLGMQDDSGSPRGDRTRLRNQMKRLFNASVQLIYEDAQVDASASSFVADRTVFWWNERKPDEQVLFNSKIRLGEAFYNEIIRNPVPLAMNTLTALKRALSR